MKHPDKKPHVGRPKGKTFPYRRQIGFSPRQWALLAEIQRDSHLDSPGAAVRHLVLAEAERRGILKDFCPSCGGQMVKEGAGSHCLNCEAA
ncbi:MAG: hypothetical protein ACREUY_03830 [Burkholderiales bacterium]